MTETENFQVIERASHSWRTEIPNIIDDIGLDPYEFRLYVALKRTAGDNGCCFQSNKTLAARIKISERKIRQLKKSLQKPREELGGLALIQVTSRKTDKGNRETDLIEITDVWPENMRQYLEKTEDKKKIGAARGAGGVRHEVPEGAARGADKEEHIKKNTREELFVADEPVGSPPSKIKVISSDGSEKEISRDEVYHRCALYKKNWKVEEIQYAWNVLAEYTGVVHDWWRFIEGTVEKFKNQLKSKKASGERNSRSQKKPSKHKENGLCQKTLPQKQKNIKKISLESGTSEQASQEYLCLGSLLNL